ncbi:MAG: type II toxin-antitoxin system HicA family toxin [Bacteroidales bacterium]
MKKLPQDLSASDLLKKLKVLGYIPTRQAGSHIRLTTEKNGIHHVTIPNHSPLKIGKLSGILKDISNHFKLSKEDLIDQLF